MKICYILGITTLLATFISAHAHKRAASPTVASQIRFLLDEEKALRQKLETRVQKLRQQAASLNNSIVQCSCTTLPPVSSSGVQVAYTGTTGTATLSSLQPTSVFNFTYDLVNVGQAFNPADGHFIAPVDGLYGFSLTVYMAVRYSIRMELVADGKPILNIQTAHFYSSRENRQENMATNFAIVNITKGTEIWPRYVSGNGYLYGSGVPTFSGYLLHEF